MAVDAVVSCEWLRAQIEAKSHDLIVLDVTWYSTKDARQAYTDKHIPGAVYLDPFERAPHTDLFPRNLPDKDAFQASLCRAGVKHSSHVILYDSEGKQGFFIASRARWHFKLHGVERVSVLDGGLQRWESLGYPTTNIVPTPQTSAFTVTYNPSLRTTFEELQSLQSQHTAQVLDSRPTDAYTNAHIPGAASLPFSSLFDGGVMKNKEDIAKLLTSHGVDITKPVVTHCNSGMSSCTLALAAEMAGCPKVSVYHGGMTEYKAKAADQLEKS